MKINEIISSVSPVFGFCDFNNIKDNLIDCAGLKRIPEKAKTVIVILFPYNLGEEYYDESNISRYAVVPDYHEYIGSALDKVIEKLKNVYPDEVFIRFTDNSPIPEVRSAIMAGLGVLGRNGVLINKDYGSWIFIGEIVTTLETECFKYDENKSYMCMNCGMCIKKCPTNAIKENYVKKNECLSDITQRKGELREHEMMLMRENNCAWGCDICQKVCPHNSNAKKTFISEFINNSNPKAVIDDTFESRAYAWRGKKVIERNLKIIK